MEIPNLQDKLTIEVQSCKVQVIKKLKFQNIIYQVGDNIRVRSEVNSQKDLFAKILIIIQAKNITPFPLIYVTWYEESDNELIANLSPEELSSKELILTEETDWQYIQAVKGKVQVISEESFIQKDPKQQQKKELFFCRSYLTKYKELIIDEKRRCFCLKLYKPQNPLIICQICKVLYHPTCSNGRDDRCMRCIC